MTGTRIFWDDARIKKKVTNTVNVMKVYVCAWGGSGFQIYVAAGNNKKGGEKGLHHNNCKLWWPNRRFMKDPGAKWNIHS